MRFQILGPLRVGGGAATVTAGRDRVVLAVLLLRANRVVPVEELVDAVWEEDPPVTARAQLQTCVSRLRQRLVSLGIPAETIVTDPAGYVVRTDTGELDAEVFAHEVRLARDALAAGRLVDASRHYRAGLALWRGPALDGVPSRVVQMRAQTLDERRIDTLEDCVDIELQLGMAAELIEELTEAVQRQPLRERLRGQLMLALGGAGRQAQALAVYQDGRRLYAEELGLDPGTELQDLHQRMLAGDLLLARPRQLPSPPVRTLPRGISDFTGRQEVISRLIKEIEGEQARVLLLDGMPGSGKTTLAVHLAAGLADRYPDAQLFLDLHGHSTRTPLAVTAAVASLLRQLGVTPERVPLDPDDRLAMWRSELTERRVLLLLDNAADAEQVTPLLPTGADSLTLITSRRRLVGLDEGRPHSLTLLDPAEAVELLGKVAGAARVAAEPSAAAEVVRRCGYLPLAIRLAGARLAHRPRWQLSDLIERLRDAGDPLAELAAGQRSVGEAFALSYAQMPPLAQRMFRLLGLHPGGRYDRTVAAALTELPLSEAQDVLDELVDAHLIEEPEPGRYRLHDLVREYARRLLDEPSNRAERDDGLGRLLHHHLDVAVQIARKFESYGSLRNFTPPDPLRPDLLSVAAEPGRAWFEENRGTLVVLCRAAERSFPRHCWQLARACWWPFFTGGYLDELTEMHDAGLRAAEVLGDEWAMALMLNYLASVSFRRAQFPHAIRLLRQAVELGRRQRPGEQLASIVWNLGSAYLGAGEKQRSLESYDEAGRLLRPADRPAELAILLNNVSYLLLHWGRYEEALRGSRNHLMLSRILGDRWQLANALGHIGAVRHRMGDVEPARRLLRTAMRLHRQTGNWSNEGEVFNDLGRIEREAGHPDLAARFHREALTLVTQAGDRMGQFTSQTLLARALLEQGDVRSARNLFDRVLEDATKADFRHQQAEALDGIARCLRATDPNQARSHWTRALALFRQLDVPEQHEVQRLLAELE
ncbi:BTAD domain-containing putative transcriptional regulator [Micromonospora sp. C95]|uniref:AfsR/SARP family transcriptional regulator n=1 Tax=Micromonospora sp. C95 TaxID=2824882 RepID=UPI001B396BAB|nr:BTAD domain-containing putative transcriptional regulator [Micromonospora sp. C95]MBQ1024375.1 tetratricopeptide repeat protein [Micromonospora sp. C95]